MTVPLRAPAARGSVPAPAGAPILPLPTDRLLDAVVGAFATFTVLFHLASRFDWSVTVTATLWCLTIPPVLLVALRGPRAPSSGGGPDVSPRPLPVVVAVGLLATAAAAGVGARVLDEPGWWAFWVAAVAVELAALVLVMRARPSRLAPGAAPVARNAVLVVVAVAVLFAIGSAVTIRPDADDVFLVNRSVWVEEKADTFPGRDTIFSDEVFVATRPENPPTAIEPFLGVLARASPLTAPTVTYLVFGPAVAALGILASWRLLRALRAPSPALATVFAALFLALDGKVHTTFGNFSFARSWQGKTAFLLVVVPLLWSYALAWSRDGDRRALLGLAVANVAAVGLTSTALFVAPAVTLLGVAAGALGCGGARRLLPGVAAMAYPVGAGLLVALGNGGAGGATRSLALAAGLHAQAGIPAPLGGVGGLDPADPWYTVLGRGVPMFVTTAAVLLAWLATRDRSSRLALVLAPLAVIGVVSAPGALHLLDDVTDARSILWRVVWIVPVPAAVGLVVAAPASCVARAWRPVTVAASTIVLVGALLLWGVPVWSGRNGTSVGRPAWDVAPGDRAAAGRLVELSRPGDVVAAPESVGGAIAVMSVDVRAVDPRGRYVEMRRKVPEFHGAERALVAAGVENGIDAGAIGAFVDALDALSVATACTRPVLDGTPAASALAAAGFREVGRDGGCVYWRR